MNGNFIVVMAGAGRGGILSKILEAAKKSRIKLRCIAVEKNPYAYLTLKYIQSQHKDWQEKVEVVNADLKTYAPSFQADLIVSELLGSFGDNELSPECLLWAQRFLKPEGISIPFNSTSYLTPVSCPMLHTKIRNQKGIIGYHKSHVVLMHRFYSSNEIKQCLYFQHPDFKNHYPLTTEKNILFEFKQDQLVHGCAGYFDSVLYKDVILSTNPETHTKEMYSWFEIFFPFEKPILMLNNQIMEVFIRRVNDTKKVWYTWSGRVCIKKEIPNDSELKQFIYETILDIPIHNQNGEHSAIFIE